jgi:hypothetical protein
VLVDSDRIALRIQAEQITALGLPTTYEDCVRDFLGLGMPGTLRILEERWIGSTYHRPASPPAAARPRCG